MASSLPFTSPALHMKPQNPHHFPLTVSSYASFSSRPFRRSRRIRRCSSSLEDPPPPPPPPPREKKKIESSEVGVSGADRRRNWRPWLGLKRPRRRPVWRRIFFASKKARSVILLNVLTVIYASDIPVLKEVEALSEPALFNMVRFVVSAIPFLPYVITTFGDRRLRTAGLELGLWVSLGYLAQALGLLTSDAGRASLISAFTVIVVPLIDGIFGASVPMLTWFGAIISLVGVAMLECGGSPPCVGDVLNILSAVFFGIHMLRTEQISRNTKKEKFLALLSFEVCVVALSSVAWFIFKDMFHDVNDLSIYSFTLPMLWDFASSFPWIPALYTGVFSTVLCLWAEMYAMGDVSATETALVYGLEPVWGAAFAWFLLGERWDTTAWIGATFVLCGSLTVQMFGSAPENAKKVERHNSGALKNSPKQDSFSLSAVPVDSRKNIGNQLKRQDKIL